MLLVRFSLSSFFISLVLFHQICPRRLKQDDPQVAHGLILRCFVNRWLGFSVSFPLHMVLAPGAIAVLSYVSFVSSGRCRANIDSNFPCPKATKITTSMSRPSTSAWRSRMRKEVVVGRGWLSSGSSKNSNAITLVNISRESCHQSYSAFADCICLSLKLAGWKAALDKKTQRLQTPPTKPQSFPAAILIQNPSQTNAFLVMRGGVSKSRARRSHLKLSRASQGKLLDAVAGHASMHFDNLLSGKLENMLTRQVQNFQEATERSRHWVQISHKVRRPCRAENGSSAPNLQPIHCLRRESG